MQRIDNYYSATANDDTHYPALENDLQVEIAIIGGGFTGVASAVELAERGHSVALLEANQIGWGATGRNGGQVTGSLSGDQAMLRQLTRRTDEETARKFIWKLRWRGHDIIRQRIERYAIQCDLKYGHLHAAWTSAHLRDMQSVYDEAQAAGFGDDVQLLDRASVHQRLGTSLYHGGLYNRRNMHLHSLNLCLGEARAAASLGVRIFENTPVLKLIPGSSTILQTAKGKISAERVLLAGNAYHRLEQRRLGGLLFPAILGNMTTAPLGDDLARQINPQDLAVYDSRMVLDYYRLTADNRLMFGGGTNYSGKDIRDVAQSLRPAMEETFPQLRGIPIDYAWTGSAGIVINRIPLLGKLHDNVWYSQGYSGHGIATTHIAAEIMAESISAASRGERTTDFDTMAAFSHWRVPMGQLAGNALLALGMSYYKLREKLLD